MRPGLGQHTQLKQELKINPRLYQAMDLLYMPLLDLQNHLKQELLNNPFLDMIEPDEEDDEDGIEQQEDPNPETEARRKRRARSIGRRFSSTVSTRAAGAKSTRSASTTSRSR
jgi:RNA polymerase sigma-54 factor